MTSTWAIGRVTRDGWARTQLGGVVAWSTREEAERAAREASARERRLCAKYGLAACEVVARKVR